ncbi:DUF2785 domain-containing protein [Microtetraspora malaysiensis]|uniref:DUF2785 domain-containing protein n=1 Tax=Microtetraspora malaysiensis TaxID=161358 RepID=UPI003D8E6929
MAAFGLHPRVDATAMLDLAVARLLAPTDHLFDQQEDERLAQAMGLVLTRPELTEDQALAWTAPIEAELGRLRSPIPAYASNCLRTLRALYVLIDQGVQRNRSAEPVRMMPHGPAIKKRITEVLAIQKAH